MISIAEGKIHNLAKFYLAPPAFLRHTCIQDERGLRLNAHQEGKYKSVY
jgi:hypothetical protein